MATVAGKQKEDLDEQARGGQFESVNPIGRVKSRSFVRQAMLAITFALKGKLKHDRLQGS
jgi:hypothetical protein